MTLLDSIRHTDRAAQHRPWPRTIVGSEGWQQAIEHLASGRCTMLGLWADAEDVYMALLVEDESDIAVIS